VDPIVKTKNRLVFVTAGDDNCEHKFLYNVSGGISQPKTSWPLAGGRQGRPSTS